VISFLAQYSSEIMRPWSDRRDGATFNFPLQTRKNCLHKQCSTLLKSNFFCYGCTLHLNCSLLQTAFYFKFLVSEMGYRSFSTIIQILVAHFWNLWMLLCRKCKQCTNTNSVMCLADNNKKIPSNTNNDVYFTRINRNFAYNMFWPNCANFK